MAYYNLVGERYLAYNMSNQYVTGRAWGELYTTEYPTAIEYTFYVHLTVAKTKNGSGNITGTYSAYAPSWSDSQWVNFQPQTSAGDTYTIFTKSGTLDKTTYAYDASFSLSLPMYAWYGDVSVYMGLSEASETITVPALDSYTVSYNANGGLSTPSSQTKWFSINLQLANSINRTGYTFYRWQATNGTLYTALGTYSANEGTTMTAQWTANTYTVQYNANPPSGKTATGSTASSSHTYNTAKALTSNGFAVADYLFKGWATSSTGGVVYTNGQSVLNLTATQGATVNLYAVWEFQYTKPNIEDVTSYRVTNGVQDDFGTNAKVAVLLTPAVKKLANGTTQYISTKVQVYYKLHTASSYTALANPPSVTTRQTVTQTITATLGVDNQYDIKVVAQGIDGGAVKVEQTLYDFITSAKFILDFNGDYDSVGFFASAPDLTDVVKVEGDTHTNNLLIYVDSNSASGTDHDLYTALYNLGWWNDVNVNV